MTKRLFVGVPVEAVHLSAFDSIGLHSANGIKIRRTPPENYHMTVAFLGNVEAQSIGFIEEALKNLCMSTESFDLPFERLGLSPDKHMLWAFFENHPEWRKLTTNVRTILNPFCQGDLLSRPQIPHVTIARSNDMLGEMEFPRHIKVTPLRMNSLVLYESQVDENGSKYSVLNTYPLL